MLEHVNRYANREYRASTKLGQILESLNPGVTERMIALGVPCKKLDQSHVLTRLAEMEEICNVSTCHRSMERARPQPHRYPRCRELGARTGSSDVPLMFDAKKTIIRATLQNIRCERALLRGSRSKDSAIALPNASPIEIRSTGI